MSQWRINVSLLKDEWNECFLILEKHFDAETCIEVVCESNGNEIDFPLPYDCDMKIHGDDAVFEGYVNPNYGYAMMSLPKVDVHHFLYILVDVPDEYSNEDIMRVFDKYDSISYSLQ